MDRLPKEGLKTLLYKFLQKMEAFTQNKDWEFNIPNLIKSKKFSDEELLELLEKSREEDLEAIALAIILRKKTEGNLEDIAEELVKKFLVRDVGIAFSKMLWGLYPLCAKCLVNAVTEFSYPKRCLIAFMEEALDKDSLEILRIVRMAENQNSSTRFFKFMLAGLDY